MRGHGGAPACSTRGIATTSRIVKEVMAVNADYAASVVEDVMRIKAHPLVPGYIPVHGYIYDCKTGRLSRCPTRRRRVSRCEYPAPSGRLPACGMVQAACPR